MSDLREQASALLKDRVIVIAPGTSRQYLWLPDSEQLDGILYALQPLFDQMAREREELKATVQRREEAIDLRWKPNLDHAELNVATLLAERDDLRAKLTQAETRLEETTLSDAALAKLNRSVTP